MHDYYFFVCLFVSMRNLEWIKFAYVWFEESKLHFGTYLPANHEIDHSVGILKHMDPVFKGWSNSLKELSILEKNQFIVSKQRCSNVLDHILGRCLKINNMVRDPEVLKQIEDLSPFHMFCYTLIRRYLEIVCLYLTRWIIVSSLFFFILSSSSLLWFLLKRRCRTKESNKHSGSNSNRLIFAIATLTLSLVTILAFLLPFLLDLVTGKVINKELDMLLDEKDKNFGNSFLFNTVSKNNVRSCSTVYDMYKFHCLQKILFNFQASDITYNVPKSASEIFCCQIQLTLVYFVTFMAYCMLNSILVLICYVIVRAFWRIFKPLSIKTYKSKQLKEDPRKPFPKLATTDHLEDFTSSSSLKEKTCLNKATSIKNSAGRTDYNKKKFKSCGVQTLSYLHGVPEPEEDIKNFTVSTTPLRNENDFKHASNREEGRSYNRKPPVPKSENNFTKNSLNQSNSSFPGTRNLYSESGQITILPTFKNASTQVCFEDSDDSSDDSVYSFLEF